MDRINHPHVIEQQEGGTYSLIVALLSDSYRRRSDCTVLFVVVTRGPPRFPVPDRYCCILGHVSRRYGHAGNPDEHVYVIVGNSVVKCQSAIQIIRPNSRSRYCSSTFFSSC